MTNAAKNIDLATKQPFNIWEGIYKTFAQAKGNNDVFDNEIWQNKLLQRLHEEQKSFTTTNSTPTTATMHEYSLPIIIAMQLAKKPELTVLDFGGGLASEYLSTLASLPNAKELQYHIVETTQTCRQGNIHLSKFKNLHFHEKLPEFSAFDIVHIGSTLQYIEDWQGMLQKLVSYSPKYLVLSDVMAGDIPTYVSTQYFYGAKIPTWFWNIKEFISVCTELKYTLLFKALYKGKFLGKHGPLPMENLPEQFRLQSACHLIFKQNAITN